MLSFHHLIFLCLQIEQHKEDSVAWRRSLSAGSLVKPLGELVVLIKNLWFFVSWWTFMWMRGCCKRCQILHMFRINWRRLMSCVLKCACQMFCFLVNLVFLLMWGYCNKYWHQNLRVMCVISVPLAESNKIGNVMQTLSNSCLDYPKRGGRANGYLFKIWEWNSTYWIVHIALCNNMFQTIVCYIIVTWPCQIAFTIAASDVMICHHLCY